MLPLLLLVSAVDSLVVRDALRGVHPSVWVALDGRKTSALPLAECAVGLEQWRTKLADGLVPESSAYPPGIDPISLVPLARLTRRHPGLLGGALRLLVSMEDGEDAAAMAAARVLTSVDQALGGGVVDELSADAALLEGEWLRRQTSGLDRLEELSRRIASDLADLTGVMEALGRRPSSEGEGGRMWGSRRSFPMGDDIDGYTTRSQDAVRSLERRTLRRKRKLLKAKFASKTLTSLDVVTPDEDDDEGFDELTASERGPIVVCLDTSHSMTGARETLSKAAVLAAARYALRQRRPVKVMAFGDTHELAEVDLQVSDVDGLVKLGKFLEHSFGGGTDVASPLRRALSHVQQSKEWRDADVVLVTDGELMDPPIDDATTEVLEREKRKRGLQVCGLLAGRARPPAHPYKNAMPGTPFARLCDTPVHTFLADKDDLSLLLRRCRAGDEEGDALEAALSAADDRLGQRKESTATMLDEAVAFVESGLIDRAIEARLVVLGAVANEHVLFYGPPGTAKSELCRRLGKLLGGSSFELALTKFTTLDDVFGPLSLRALDDDEYRRCDTGIFAQHADTVFLDEIFRAKSVLPALLGLLNERKWWDGPEIKRARLVSAVAASNSLPDEDDDGALFDRFLLRCVVRPVADDKVPALLLLEQGDDERVDPPRFRLSKDSTADLPNFAVEFLCRARVYLRDVLGERISDRRLRKCGDALRRVAAACGRNRVNCLDLLVARYILWSKPATLPQVDAWLFDNIVPSLDPAFVPLLADAADRPGEEGLDQIDALVDCLAEAAVEMRRNVQDLERAYHPLVAPADLDRARLDLAKVARDRYGQLEQLLSQSLDLRRAKVCGDDTFEIDFSVVSNVDAKPTSLPPETSTDESQSFDLTWSKKQAKARLSAADFRQWTAARRNRSSQTT